MRISDWSSDVCSSDLERTDLIQHLFALVTARLEDALIHAVDGQGAKARRHAAILAPAIRREIDAAAALLAAIEAIETQARASDGFKPFRSSQRPADRNLIARLTSARVVPKI